MGDMVGQGSEWIRWGLGTALGAVAAWFGVMQTVASRLSAVEAQLAALKEWTQRLDAKLDRVIEDR